MGISLNNLQDIAGDYSKYLNKDTLSSAKNISQSVGIFQTQNPYNINPSLLNEIEIDDVIDVAKDQYDAYTGKNIPDKETLKKHETYAHLAQDTRSPESNGEIDGYKRIDTIENDENGFGACVYENEETGDIVLSYRCTDNEGGIESDKQLAKGEIPDQYEDALKAYDELKEKYPDRNIQIVGYSLGGSLAELVAAEREDASAVTFEGYGTKDIVENNDRFKDNGNCLNYTTQDSLVSGSSLHTGNTLTIKHDGGGAETLYDQVANRHYIDNFYDLQNAEFANETVEDAKRSTKQKGKDAIIDNCPDAIDLASDYFFG